MHSLPHRWWLLLVVAGLVVLGCLPGQALAQDTPVAAASSGVGQAARVGYQRDRLSVQPVGERWYVVVDGYGRTLTARQFARALGDVRTFDVAVRASQQQQAVGAVCTTGGPLTMLVGLNRVATGDLRGASYMRGAGYATLVLGMAGTAGGIALLADRRPRHPPTFYPREQAERLVRAHNQRLLDSYGLPPEAALLLPRPAHRLRARVMIGLTAVGVHGSF